MKAENFFELRPESQLLNVHFNGYKLSLDNFPCFHKELHFEVHEEKPNKYQFGFDHAKVFAEHNYLIRDTYYSTEDEHIFYVISNDDLYNISFRSKEKELNIIRISTLMLSANRKDDLDHYPPVLSLIDSDYGIISDGFGQIFLYESKTRQKREWKVCHNFNPIPSNDGCRSFTLLDSRRTSDTSIAVLLRSIVANENSANKAHFWNELFLLNLINESGKWSVKCISEILCEGHMELAGFQPHGSSIIIISCGLLKFREDMMKDIEMEVVQDEQQMNIEEEQSKLYAWMQTSEDVTIVFNMEQNILKEDMLFSISPQSVHLAYHSCILLNGQLGGDVEVSSSTYIIDGNKLELVLFKSNPTEWKEVVIGDKRGTYEIDKNALTEAINLLDRFSSSEMYGDSNKLFNQEQLEECDAMNEEEDFSKIQWVCPETRLVKHECDITRNAVLFALKKKSAIENICLRMDIDGILWTFSNDDKKPIYHEATFNAFGYVQASKTKRKFCTCSPSYSYAVIVETQKNAFLYRQSKNIDSVLRNRRSGEEYTDVAIQNIVHLKKDDNLNIGYERISTDNILGTYADDHFLFILTTNDFFVFSID